jgi:hypothetical protein
MWQPGVTLETLEREAIFAAIQFYKGDHKCAARSLGISDAEMEKKVGSYDQLKRAEEEREYQRRQERERFLRRQRGLREDGTIAGQEPPNSLPLAPRRVDVQSPAQAAAKQPLSVPVGKEVQGVSPQTAPGARRGKNRSGV